MIRRARPVAILATTLLVLTGCSAHLSIDAPESAGTITVEATCKRLFGPDIEGPIADTIDIIARADQSADLSGIEVGEVSATIISLTSIATMAHPDLKADVEALLPPLEEFEAALRDGATTTVDTRELQEASLRLIDTCEPHL